MEENGCNSIKQITIVSNWATSHFKNRLELYELKPVPYDINCLFSATGHGKGAVDGVDGLIKHYVTFHNLQKPLEKAIQNDNDFVKFVENYANAIKIIHL